MMNDELNEEIQELKKALQEYSNEVDELYSLDNPSSQKTMIMIEEINKEKKELKEKINVFEKEKKELETKMNNVNNEHPRLVNYFKRYKVLEKLKKNVSEHEGLEESDFKDSSGFDKDTKSEYDSNGFDIDGRNKDTGSEYNRDGFNGYGINQYTKTKYNRNGFDRDGKHKDTKSEYDSNGFDRHNINQYTKTKYDCNGFDIDGRHKYTGSKYNRDFFDRHGINQYTKTKYDSNGFDRHGIHKDTKSEYDSNGFDIHGINQYTKIKYNRDDFDRYGFDRYGKHKDTGVFLNNENINWLKNKHEFLKLYNEIIKNGEFSENINKKNISSYEFKKIIENILNGKVDSNKMIKKIETINKIENDLNDLKENENINTLKNYIKKLRNSIYGKDKEKIKTDQAKSFGDQKGKGCVNLPIALSKIYTNNSSTKLINNIKQLINDLYDTKQITKQVYNNLIKAITYK